MAGQIANPEAYLDAMAPVMDLTIDPAWRPGVVRFLNLAAAMAATLDAVPLADDDLEMAPVFMPEVGPHE